MTNIEKLEKEKNEYLKNLTVPELKGYIDNLIRNYYDSYIKNDNERLTEYLEEISLFIQDFNILYPNISNYINSRMVFMSNKCLEHIFKRGFELYCPVVDIQGESTFSYREFFDDELIDKIIQEEQEIENNCNCGSCKYRESLKDEDS